jgi:hypothetical protein
MIYRYQTIRVTEFDYSNNINGLGRFKPVYKELPIPGLWRGVTNFADVRKKKGVYMIKENGKLIYIGSSAADVYHTLMNHFHKWEEGKPEYGQGRRLTYVDNLTKIDDFQYTARVIVTPTAAKAHDLEARLIKKYKPRDNYYYPEVEEEEAPF